MFFFVYIRNIIREFFKNIMIIKSCFTKKTKDIIIGFFIILDFALDLSQKINLKTFNLFIL